MDRYKRLARLADEAHDLQDKLVALATFLDSKPILSEKAFFLLRTQGTDMEGYLTTLKLRIKCFIEENDF